jgi:hypothetical protein
MTEVIQYVEGKGLNMEWKKEFKPTSTDRS